MQAIGPRHGNGTTCRCPVLGLRGCVEVSSPSGGNIFWSVLIRLRHHPSPLELAFGLWLSLDCIVLISFLLSITSVALCDWCGAWKGNKLCSNCGQVRYCSKKHQVMSWRSGHKTTCQQPKVYSSVCGPNINETTSMESHKVGSNTLWPELEIIKDESEYSRDMSEDNNTLPISSDSLNLRSSIVDTMNSLSDSFQVNDDKRSWDHFWERIVEAPKQVLRYYRDINAQPVWPVSRGRPSSAVIPNCNYCGGPMCCEFQILPQLLYFFEVDNESDSLDWATIVVLVKSMASTSSMPLISMERSLGSTSTSVSLSAMTSSGRSGELECSVIINLSIKE
ncbi:hypothetical protein RIF29_14600 [Crotalaria pallida]|uniref:MYND-type domain-containing protein n=1 Tax=Crotalaria pallida TaxID=3830 RepID=A0AAN9FDP1_CROPI